METKEPLWPLTADERVLVRECVSASVHGPFFRWWKFPEDDPLLRPDPAQHHPSRCRIVSRERYERSSPHEREWGEFHTIFGLDPEEVVEILDAWPDFHALPKKFLMEELVGRAINNAMGNLLGYPHRCDDVWGQYISASREDVGRVFAKWKTPRRSKVEQDPIPGSETTVDELLDRTSERRRAHLQAVRRVVLANLAPGFEEVVVDKGIRWQVPLSECPGRTNGLPLGLVSVAPRDDHACLYLQAGPTEYEGFRTGPKDGACFVTRHCVRIYKVTPEVERAITEAISRWTVDTLIAQRLRLGRY